MVLYTLLYEMVMEMTMSHLTRIAKIPKQGQLIRRKQTNCT